MHSRGDAGAAGELRSAGAAPGRQRHRLDSAAQRRRERGSNPAATPPRAATGAAISASGVPPGSRSPAARHPAARRRSPR